MQRSTTKPEWSRRRFISTLSGAGAYLMLNPLRSWAVPQTDTRIAQLAALTMGIDTHNHIDVPLNKEEQPGPKVDLAGELKRSGLAAVCMAFATDYQRSTDPEAHYERFLNGMTAMDAILQDNLMKRALNLANLTTARHEHRPTVIQSVEGAHFLNGKLERLEVAYQRGLRHLTLLHDSDAAVPLGDVYTNPSQWNGLTDFGAEVLRACNRMGIVTDLAHASNDTLNAALKIAQQPVIISHTGLNTQIGTSDFQNNMMMPRLISAEQAKIVAQAGGVIGIWTHLADSPLAYAQHIRAMVDVVGIDHVCIGTDTKLTPAYRKPETAAAGKQAMKETGNAGAMQTDKPKQMEHKPRPGERTNEAWTGMTSGFYYAVVEALVQTGFNEAEIGKIGSGNFCRVFAAATR